VYNKVIAKVFRGFCFLVTVSVFLYNNKNKLIFSLIFLKPMSDTKQLLENLLNKAELSISRANFTTWFKNTQIIKIEKGTVYLGVPSSFVKGWLQQKYHNFILRSLREDWEKVRAVEYVVISRSALKKDVGETQTEEDGDQKTQLANKLPLQDLYINKEDNLNPRYTFDAFVVGPFNELAHAASQAILKNPGIAYNPLFIYGGTGLGKTHLIQAIGNQMKTSGQEKKVYYTTSERFYLDYVTSVQSNKVSVFKERYRTYDFFIIDDVQYFSGKSGTQDELFHLFNVLVDNNKQLIFSSDRHYNYIPALEDRLKSRFGAGMLIDIAEPDFESKVAILRSKTQNVDPPPNEDVLEFIAQNMQGSIRELEGALNTIICQAQLKNRDLTINEIQLLIKSSEKPKQSVSPDDLIKIVAEFYNVEKDAIYKKTRRKEVVKPRQVVMYLLREDFRISYPAIGNKLGGRDHTTVIHSCEKIRGILKNDIAFLQEIDRIRSML
jgi:chromosomal replication initiator protein